jgi:hypothetical protein
LLTRENTDAEVADGKLATLNLQCSNFNVSASNDRFLRSASHRVKSLSSRGQTSRKGTGIRQSRAGIVIQWLRSAALAPSPRAGFVNRILRVVYYDAGTEYRIA